MIDVHLPTVDRRLMAVAGLWENWRSPAGEWVRTFAITTTAPHRGLLDMSALQNH
jgi:putative SOS response-associated peptidase YedK